ncbi:hypothetical protein [Amycolatopsis sp. La24]|nr:hypothetical protein [Amycolatopsis sp. La24]
MSVRTLRPGFVSAVIAVIPDASVDCCMVRLSRAGPAAVVSEVRALAAELRRVLRADGSAWFLVEEVRTAAGLAGRPWQAALELQRSGWLLRNAVVAESDSGPNETVLFCVKQTRYFFDLAAVRSALGSNRGDVVLAGEPHLTDRIVLAACRPGGTVLDLTVDAEAAARRWGRSVVPGSQAIPAA